MKTRGARVSGAKALVVAVLLGAMAFGLYLGYLAYANNSFPVKEKPFGDYASVVESTFNGTEYYFKLQWSAPADYTPLYAQLTSPSSDVANTPVCDIGGTPAQNGETLDLPFAIAAPSTSLSNVDLSIAVRANSNMTEFTIVYHVDRVLAAPGLITPSDIACAQPSGLPM